MMRTRLPILLLLTTVIGACASEEVISDGERARQQTIDTFIAQVLFDHDMDSQASYAVHRNGKVVIKFGENVSSRDYTLVVGELRANPEIPAVYAEQSGKEVCGIVLNQ